MYKQHVARIAIEMIASPTLVLYLVGTRQHVRHRKARFLWAASVWHGFSYALGLEIVDETTRAMFAFTGGWGSRAEFVINLLLLLATYTFAGSVAVFGPDMVIVLAERMRGEGHRADRTSDGSMEKDLGAASALKGRDRSGRGYPV